MIELKFSLTPNPEKVRREFAEAAERMSDYRPAFRATTVDMVDHLEETIKSQPLSWVGLRDKWLREKQRRGLSTSIMIATGKLLGSFRRVQMTNKLQRVGTRLHYAGPASWGTRRPFNLVSDDLESTVTDAVEKRIERVLEIMIAGINAR